MSRALVVLFMLVVALPRAAAAQSSQASLAWDPSASAEVAGYLIEYGTASGVYSRSVKVGLRTEWAIDPDLAANVTYFFAVRGYTRDGAVTPRSTEIIYTPGAARTAETSTTLILRHAETGSVASWQMKGLQQVSSTILGAAPVDRAWTIVGTGDFDGDAQRDLIWQHTDGWIAVWLMKGARVVSARMLAPDRVAETEWRIAAVVDLDQDGKPDLVWQHQGSGRVAAWLMDGITRRDSRLLGEIADLDWKIVGAGDFDGDRSSDLLWRNRTSGELSVWYMSGDRLLSGRGLSPAVNDLEWKAVTVVHPDGGSTPAIVWQHNDGRLGLWAMNSSGPVFAASTSPASVPDPQWRIVAGR